MQRITRFAAIAALGLLASRASAQSITYNFEDGTDQGWGSPFGSDADTNFTIVTDPAPGNGSHYMQVPRTGFQVAGADNNPPALVAAMNAAAANPTGYDFSYDWYINTALYPSPGTFLQLGSYVNGGTGYYQQDASTPNEVSLNGTQLASGGVLSGHVDVPISVYSPDSNGSGPITNQSASTFWRIGLIENGNGTIAVDYDNISIHPVPEPASLALIALGLPMLAARRRRV